MSDAVAIALIAAFPPTLVALAALIVGVRNSRKVDSVHLLINSRMTELLASTGAAARAEGHTEGVDSEQARTRGAEL